MKKIFTVGLFGIIGFIIGNIVKLPIIKMGSTEDKKVKLASKNKFKSYYNVLNEWLILKQKGVNFEERLLAKGYSQIAIYGLGELGNRLLDELEDSQIQVKYAVDRESADIISIRTKVYTIKESLDVVDAIVVTPIFDYEKIQAELQKKVNFPIISLEDIIYEN